MENKDRDVQWYVVNTYSGHENTVKTNLLRRVESMNLTSEVHRVVVAEVEVEEKKEGIATGKVKMKNLYPGYIFIEMQMTNEAWFMVRNTPGVTGFVGSSGGGTKPFPVPREQIEPVLKRMGEVDESMYDRYIEGDNVKVIHGPLADSEGKVISIDRNTGAVKIEVTLFGRPTLVDVDFGEIEKI